MDIYSNGVTEKYKYKRLNNENDAIVQIDGNGEILLSSEETEDLMNGLYRKKSQKALSHPFDRDFVVICAHNYGKPVEHAVEEFFVNGIPGYMVRSQKWVSCSQIDLVRSDIETWKRWVADGDTLLSFFDWRKGRVSD